MPHVTPRRGALRLLAASCLAPLASLNAQAASARATAARLDAVYIPALFLTGSAGKSETGPAKARAAMTRLQQDWPALQTALAASRPGDADWRRALQQVHGHIETAARQVAQATWAESHETLEQVRLTLYKARRARGLPYLLDDFTAFHEAMEAIANTPDAGSEVLLPRFAHARALWRPIELAQVDPADWGLSSARLAQLQSALSAETQALSRLSQALTAGDAARLSQAAAAIKGPFVQAYTAFGWPAGESLPLRD